MNLGDVPSIASSTYTATTFGLANHNVSTTGMERLIRMAEPQPVAKFKPAVLQQEKKPMSTRRIVKVIIMDPNDNVPLEDCILYSGPEKMTDATDQELFFEVDIKGILNAHNAKRTKSVNKDFKERTVYLEPAKIRDLKMVVVNVATF